MMLPVAMPGPRPDRTPQDVVRIVTAALRQYNLPSPNAGIFIAYSFASPANHAVTGPYGKFIRLLKTEDNAPLLHSYPSELSPMRSNGDYAHQIVTVHVKPGQDAVYEFILHRQPSEPYRDCWMVDTVRLLVK
jgi:hypothetical protein